MIEQPDVMKPTQPDTPASATSGSGAYGGLDTVNQGASQIGKSLGEVGQNMAQSSMALQQGQQALGGGNSAGVGLGGGTGGGFQPMSAMSPKESPYKKGGSVGYAGKSGSLNLGSGRVSTASKNKSNSSW